MNIRRFAFAVLALTALAPLSTRAFAQSTTSRLALVIGEAQYRDGPLATAANDGGLMADLLRQAGYDVTGAANLSQDQIRASFREFLEKAAAAGPGAEVFVYLSGKGVQFAGDNYLAPVEATMTNSATVPSEAVRLSDFLVPLEGLPARARVIVLDLARGNSFGRSGPPLASGLAIIDAPSNTLVAFNAAPGTLAPDDRGPYSAYAQSLVEMLRQPGLPLNDVFAQVRLRVNESTRGAQTPWDATKLPGALALFAPAPGAPAVAPPMAASARRPMRDVSPQEAYGYAVEADTFEAYNQFLVAYPSDPLARRVRAMLAARREAITWRRTFVANTPEAYWTYLQRYPRGPHSPDAERRLAFLSAPLAPPPRFREYDAYDIPPPPPEEIVIVDRPRFYVNEVVDVPPPRFSEEFLPPVPREYRDLPPPPPPPRMGFLPIPVPIPIPFARPQAQPGIVVAPRFVQQPAAQPGGPAPAAAPVPQGYSPSPTGGRGPGGEPGNRPVPQAQPVPPGAPAAQPAGRPPQAVPGVAPGAAQGAAPTAPAAPPASPSQTLPRPERTPGAPPVAAPPAGVPSVTPGARSPAAPGAAAPQTLPSPAAPLPGGGERGPNGATRPVTPPAAAPSRDAPANREAVPATRDTGPASRELPTPPREAPGSRTAPGSSGGAPASRELPAAPTPRAVPSERTAPPTPRAEPRGEPPAPRAAPAERAAPVERSEPRAAPPIPRAAPIERAAPVERSEPRAAPAAPPIPRAEPRAEPARPAAPPPAPHIEAPRPSPAAPPAAAAPHAGPPGATHAPGGPGGGHEGRPGGERP